MWRLTALVILTVLHKDILSQPITDNNDNDWPTTHLDLEESCSCEDLEKSNFRRDARYDDSIDAGTEDELFSTRDLDDCPCRYRDTDSQGASSLLFPTATRSTGPFAKTSEKKEERKPIFNPEVDLASSVLETLRVVTDEEYEEALARDAAKSSARTVENIVFGDATPQESANVVTIVVNPKLEDNSDVISHVGIKQSRCINPLQRASSPNFISSRQKLYKNRHYHRNLQDTDSEVGASTVDEQILSLDEHNKEFTSNSVGGHNNVKRFKINNEIDDNPNILDLKSSLVQNKLQDFDLASTPLLQRIKDKIRPLSRVSKLKLQSLDESKKNFDLSPASSIVHEQTVRKVPFLNNNSKLESLKQTSRPLSIMNLLNLKDVELLPLRDLIRKHENKGKILKSGPLLSSIYEHDDGELLTENASKGTDSETTRIILRSNPIEDSNDDPKSIQSVVNFEITPMGTDDCQSEREIDEISSAAKNKEYKTPKETSVTMLEHDHGECSIENDSQDLEDLGTTRFTEVSNSVIDKISDPESSPSLINVQTASKETQITSDSCENVDVTKGADTKSSESWPISTENLSNIPIAKDEATKIAFDNDNDCVEDERNDQDSNTDTSNTISNTIEHLETRSSENENIENDKENNVEDSDELKTAKESKLKLLDPISIDKTISNIKNYILKKQEDLNSLKTNLKNRNIANKNSEDILASRNVNEDCENAASAVITTLKPEVLNNNLDIFTTSKLNLLDDSLENTPTTLTPNMYSENNEDTNLSAGVSMQDLQKLSDAMLQEEKRDSTNTECDKSPDEEEIKPESKNNLVLDFLDSDSSQTNAPRESIVEAENLVAKQEKSAEINSCKTDLPLQSDLNSDASEMILNTIPKRNEILGRKLTLKPTIDQIKNPLQDKNDILKLSPLDPLHTIGNIKDTFTRLFEKNERDPEVALSSPVDSNTEALDLFKPVMMTDFNTPKSNSPLRTPFVRLSEGHDRSDNFEQTQKSSLLPNIPKFDIQSNKSNSLLSKGFQSEPTNLKSTLEDKYSKRNYVKATNNLNDYLDPLNDVKSQLIDSSIEASNNIYSSLKNTQNDVESKLRQLKLNKINTLKTPIKSSSSFLDTLSRNHEDMSNKLRVLHMDINDRVESIKSDMIDGSKLLTSGYRGTKPNLKSPGIFNKQDYENINDKLRALHMDFNDRIESMRNDINDRSKLLTSGSRVKSNLRPSNNFNKQNKLTIPLKKTWQISNRREPKLLSARKQTPLKLSPSHRTLLQKKLRMPAAASVPVPQTVQVPELKTTSAKLPPSLRTISRLTPNTNSKVNEDVPRNFGGQANNLQLHRPFLTNKMNLKNDKIKVSISTTPRPEILKAQNLRSSMPQNIGRGKFEARRTYEDHSGSPSEIKHSKTLVPSYDEPSKYRYANADVDNDVLSFDKIENQDVSKPVLQSWPKATESAFLSKVKEAVRARLSNVNLAKASKKSSKQADTTNQSKELSVFHSDMSRSASENNEVVHGSTLKENVSYKCKMICTKE